MRQGRHWASRVQNAIAHDEMGQTDVRNSPITTFIDHINIGQGDYSGSKTLISAKDKGTHPDRRRNHNLTDKGQEQRGDKTTTSHIVPETFR